MSFPARGGADEIEDIAFYLRQTAFGRVFSHPQGDEQARLAGQVFRYFQAHRTPEDDVLLPTWTGYNPNWSADTLVLPCMRDVRASLLDRFRFIDRVVALHDQSIKDLSWDQAHQLADAFMVLRRDREFEFEARDATRELAGVLTNEISLLHFHGTFISYLLGRTIAGEPKEHRSVFGQLRLTILAQVPEGDDSLREELRDFLAQLQAGNFLSTLRRASTDLPLSRSARAVLTQGAETFRQNQVLATQRFLSERKGGAATRLFEQLAKERRQQFGLKDVENTKIESDPDCEDPLSRIIKKD